MLNPHLTLNGPSRWGLQLQRQWHRLIGWRSSPFVRMASQSDQPALAAMLQELGPQSCYRRYLSQRTFDAVRAANEARRILAADPGRLVLVAEDRVGRLVGVIEVAPHWREPAAGELAIIVHDAVQGQGVGRTLMLRMAKLARASGLRALRANLFSDNLAMRRLFELPGRPVVLGYDCGEIELEVALASPHRPSGMVSYGMS